MCIRDRVYATLIPDCGHAKMYADKLAEMVPGFIFQVRGAGTVSYTHLDVYKRQQNTRLLLEKLRQFEVER